VARLIQARRCGSVLHPGNEAGLVQEILNWFFDLNRYQEGCRQALLAARQATASHAADQFDALLRMCVTGPRSGTAPRAGSTPRQPLSK
jgi:hypothetical protein